MMNEYDSTEVAYKNGMRDGFTKGFDTCERELKAKVELIIDMYSHYLLENETISVERLLGILEVLIR